MVEKPAPGAVPSTLAVVGRYILHPEVMEELEHTGAGRNGEIQLTDAIQTLTQKRAVYGVMFTGQRFDAGEKLGFLKASIEIALRNPDLAAGLREYLNKRDPEL
jgi:UTP--glucose-1-phosphate uridylyltransferase